MVARGAIASGFCILAALADTTDIPPYSSYTLKKTGRACPDHTWSGIVSSWGDCQKRCDDTEGCDQFTVYSTTNCGHQQSSTQCTACELDMSELCHDTVKAKDRDAVMFQRVSSRWPPELIWPTRGRDGDAVLRQHNIYRCMHGFPPLQWSPALQKEAQKWSASADSVDALIALKKQDPLPPPAPFNHLEQNVGVLVQGSASATSTWWDLTQIVDSWYRKDLLKPVLDKNTIYVGCGGNHAPTSTPDGNGVANLVCNYGSLQAKGCWNQHAQDAQGNWGWCMTCDGGNLLNCCTKDLTYGCEEGQNCKCTSFNIPNAEPVHPSLSSAAPTKSARQCALDIDSSDRFQNFVDHPPHKQLIISYKPKLPVHTALSASTQTGPCDPGNIKDYRLVLDNEQLKLVAVNGDTHEPCEGTGVSKFEGWETQLGGMWDRSIGDKNCLKMLPAPDFKLSVNKDVPEGDNTECTSNNKFFNEGSGGWHFRQQSIDSPMGDWCMMEVPGADGSQLSATDLPIIAAGDGKGCSTSWTAQWFHDQSPLKDTEVVPETILQSDPKDSCPKCLASVGWYACALQDRCSLAPTALDCNAQGGTWCGPVDWKVQGSCGHPLHRCDGAVDPTLTPGPADCHQLGGVYKTHYTDCALIADGKYTEDNCRASLMRQNNYEEQDVTDCVNLVKQTRDKPANVFDTVHGYIYDDPKHPPYCRLWYCSKLSDDVIPKQDGDQAWLIAYKPQNTKSSLSIMV